MVAPVLWELVVALHGMAWRLSWMSVVFLGEVYLIVAEVAALLVSALLAIQNRSHPSLPFRDPGPC